MRITENNTIVSAINLVKAFKYVAAQSSNVNKRIDITKIH